MDDLPDLPLEKLLGYLHLTDLVRCRRVSRRWYEKISAFKVRSLCYSDLAGGQVESKHRLVVGDFARNYLRPAEFEQFFGSLLGRSMLSGLRSFRLCDVNVNTSNREKSSALARILQSFGQLEELDLIRVIFPPSPNEKLNLPSLRRIRLEDSDSLDLKAPRLAEIDVLNNIRPRLTIRYCLSVQRLLTRSDDWLNVQQLSNLQVLVCGRLRNAGDKFLDRLKQLKELHLNGPREVLVKLHEQRRRLRRNSLQIFYQGLCLDAPQDYGDQIESQEFDHQHKFLEVGVLRCMIANASRLADRLPLYQAIRYTDIESMVSRIPADFWARLSHLRVVGVNDKVKNVDHLLAFLKNCDVECMEFTHRQPQTLFDRLPSSCLSLRKIGFFCNNPTLNLTFLLELRHLMSFKFVHQNQVDLELIMKCFQRLQFIRTFEFLHVHDGHRLNVHIGIDQSEQFYLGINFRRMTCAHLDELFELLRTGVQEELYALECSE